MAPQSHAPAPNPQSGAAPPPPAGSHTGLHLAAAALVTVGFLLTAGYAVSSSLVAVSALALQSALVAATVWATLNAARLRRRLHGAEDFLRIAGGGSATAPRWASDEYVEHVDPEEAYQIALGDVFHARKLHYIFLALLPIVLVAGIAIFMLWRQAGVASPEIGRTQATALGILLLAASTIWLVLARSFMAIEPDELPEGSLLGLAFRETQWASVVVAAAMLGSLLWAPLQSWAGWLILLWIAAVAGEQVGRTLIDWLRRPAEPRPTFPATRIFLREAVLIRGNPIASVFETIESRYGVSFRSSWAIRFVRSAAVPLALLAGLFFWGLSSLAMVGPSELGIRETFGKIDGKPLQPGLHFKLPWPLGRVRLFPVKRVFARPFGFEVKLEPGQVAEPPRLEDFDMPPLRALLWTKAHAERESAVMLGGGVEAITIDAVIYCKIREDEQGLFDYAYRFQNPGTALDGYAFRTLMELTRHATLDEVLTTNRKEFTTTFEQMLQRYCDANRLGVEVVDMALVNLHPPIPAAPDYLDVISARIDADRFLVEETGKRDEKLQLSQMEGGTAVAGAKVQAANRLGEAAQKSSEILAIRGAYEVAPDAFRIRMRNRTLGEVLESKPLILIDPSFSVGPGETTIDLRPEPRRESNPSLPGGM